MDSQPRASGIISAMEWLVVLTSCVAASIVAIVWSWRHGALLDYGDAVAHLHIARRVFDCRQPRFSQLGSVWLPLPHILLIPFVQVYSWWANGLAAIVPSALAWLGACAGIYRLARQWLPKSAAAVALCFFAANPNLLYLQTTAMTEPLFVCEMVWLVALLVAWQQSLNGDGAPHGRTLWLIALILVAAIFTRYDGWIMALLAWSAVGVVLWRRGELASRTFWLASALVVAAPAAWFIYNAAAFGDWLYFARGPYSAAAIEMRTSVPGFPPHPGWHNPWVAFIFYMKAVEMDAAALAWGNWLVALSLVGAAWAWVMARQHALRWALLLVLPLPFYTYSVAYGSVPIFLPVWWPFSWYNLRYGIELLPALALGVGFAAEFVFDALRVLVARRSRRAWATAATVFFFAAIGWNVLWMLRQSAQVYVEGTKNRDAHRPYETQIPLQLETLLAAHPTAVILMDTSFDPEIVALTGIPLRQTINESDLQIYRDALAAPAGHAAIVLAFDGDEIARAVHDHPAGLTEYRRFSAPFQPDARLYVSSGLASKGSTTGPAR